ncbi:MAG TPA: ceramide glucosyltransferase [Bdellovibrionota bacterium]|nr:ceramide glucosyltransferase [Bdellovibrionota bacterium]
MGSHPWNWLGLAIWALAVTLQVAGTVLSLKRMRLSSGRAGRVLPSTGPAGRVLPSGTPPSTDGLPPVTILKPLKGVDDGLELNLESFFRQSYPEYELIFSVKDRWDPAAAVVRDLMRRYPHVPARLFTGAPDVGVNPKVCNLVKGYARAKYDVVLVSDSNTRAEPGFLASLARELNSDGTGVVTAVFSGRGARGLGGRMEALALETFYTRGTFVADSLGEACVTGKAMMFRRSDADRFGGMAALADYLAEDFVLGKRMEEIGRRVRVASTPVLQHLGDFSVVDYWKRQLRWGRIRKCHGPGVFAVEVLLLGALVSGLIGAASLESLISFPLAPFMALHLSVWALCDGMMVHRLHGRVEATVPTAWLTRELLAPALWLAIACGSTVEWRGQKLRLLRGGRVEGAGDEQQHDQDPAPVSVGGGYQQSSGRGR